MSSILNNQQDDDNDPNDRSGANAPGTLNTIGTMGSSAPAAGGGATAPSRQPQGSGRFTNLQKYIKANQGAGKNIAGSVGKGIKEEIGKEHREAGEYYKNLGTAISGANKVAQEGHKYQKTLEQIGSNIKGAGYDKAKGSAVNQRSNQDFGAEAFTKDPGFSQFQNIQAGRGIDERLLSLKQQQASRESGQYLDTARGAQDQLSSQGGRFDLLRKTFGGAARPGYSTGQQRLDQALLSQNGLGDLRREVGGEVRSATEANRDAVQAGGEVSRIATQEQGLMSDLNNQTATNQQSYNNMLQTYVDPIQKLRNDEWTRMQNAVGGTNPGQALDSGPGLSKEQLEQLGVTGQHNAFNVFNDLTAGDVASAGTRAEKFGDIASTRDVARANALASMSGRDSNIMTEGNLGDAVVAKTGEQSLSGKLAAAQSIFDENAKNKQFADNFRGSTGRDIWGHREDYWGGANAGAEDLLAGGDVNVHRDGAKFNTRNQQATAEQNVRNQFNAWLKEQGHGNKIG